MAELTKYQQLKMYLPVNGYDSIKELADDWGCTTNAIRNNCRGTMTSERLTKKTNQFIANGEKRFKEHRKNKLASTKG